MLGKIGTLALGALLALMAACSPPPPPPQPVRYTAPVDTRMSTNELSRKLEVGMTEAQVLALREPDRVTVSTCGSNTPRPWKCRTYQYGSSLHILFQEINGRWLVNGWF